MSLGRTYLAGVGLVAAGGAVGVAAAPAELRVAIGWGVGTGLALQAPLGWITLRAIGSDRFMVVWGLGMLTRLGVVAIAGLVLLPVLGVFAGPMLGSMVVVLVALLLVEGVAAMGEHSREDEQ